MTINTLRQLLAMQTTLALDAVVLAAMKQEARRLKRAKLPAHSRLQRQLTLLSHRLNASYSQASSDLTQQFLDTPPGNAIERKAQALADKAIAQGLLNTIEVCKLLDVPYAHQVPLPTSASCA